MDIKGEGNMKRQTVLGVVFLIVGVLVLLAALASVLQKQLPSLPFVGIGLGTAIFGAWLVPSSGVGDTVNQISITGGNTILPVVGGRGGRRAGEVVAPVAEIEIPPSVKP
jgi:hypothetical protein